MNTDKTIKSFIFVWFATALISLAIVLAALAGAVWVVVKVLQWTHVL
jgi:hypothetical protein